MCELSNEETCSVWDEQWFRARMKHSCGACGVTIGPGHRYCRTFMLFEGHASADKLCAACWAVRDAFGQEHRLYPSASTLTEHLHECISEGGESARRWRPRLRAIGRRTRKAAGHG